MNNEEFFDILKKSFSKYIETNARSNEKLKILHGAIAEDLHKKLSNTSNVNGNYSVHSLGFGNGREVGIAGRYANKTVDIAVKKNGNPVAGIAIKYVMSNYKQNSNNYFENMLGETANIRSSGIPYFQILVIPDKMPYFDKDGIIKKWEVVNKRNINKYIVMSNDNVDVYLHAPNKTLISIVNISEGENLSFIDKSCYKKYYTTSPFSITASSKSFEFGNNTIYNNCEGFIKSVVSSIIST
ncbi:MAG: hypothetical protein FWE21_10240 [Defluviitaleaceae bacterium]|nr:hypothetical protein [Defluviitaleaceae bacterium]